jgi:membrane peptidoglycan carboxypeptidase
MASYSLRGPGAGVGMVTAFVTCAALTGLLSSALLIPAVALTAVAAGAARSTAAAPLTLGSAPAPQTSVMLAADGSTIARFYAENRVDVPLTEISPLAQRAIVSVEDARFFQHGAADPRGLARAALTDLTGGATEGGSTLTQQYVKNLLLEQAVAAHDLSAEQAAVARTLPRKLRELRLAVWLEHTQTKQQILEGYLNIVYFGENSYGIEAAAQRYFGTSAARLTLPQAAFLAGVVQDPAGFDPIAHPVAARARRDLVLTDMLRQKLITTAQYRAAAATPLTVNGAASPNGCASAGADAFFCDYVVRSILTSPDYAALGPTAGAREQALLTGGLVIHTTLRPDAQQAAVTSVNQHLPATDRSRLAASAVTVEPGTGEVVAMAQDRAYSVTPGRGRTSINYGVDTSLGGSQGFQTGSSFKPFTLATWLAAGGHLTDTVDATRRAFPFSSFTSCGQPLRGSQPYSPGNSEGNLSGPMSVLTATADSVNVAYVAMESRLDLCDIASTAASLGVHLATPERECSATGPASTDLPACLPSLTLGVKDIAPLTMAAAYAGFASGGTFCAPEPVTRISSASATLVQVSQHCRRVLARQVASGVNTALHEVLTDGTAAAVGPLPTWPSAGKTGTTDGPYDTWFVGYTAQFSTAVWVGDPGRGTTGARYRKRLTNLDVAGRYYPVVYGASIAAPIWKQMMAEAMRGEPAQALP